MNIANSLLDAVARTCFKLSLGVGPLRFVQLYITRSSAVAQRPRDTSCNGIFL